MVIAGELPRLVERRVEARLVNGILADRLFHRSGRAIKNFREAWITACVAAGVGKMICRECGTESVHKKCPQCKVRTKYSGRLFLDFRRTGLNTIRAGVPQNVAMKISGHKTASMFRRYDIASEQDLREAMEKVARYRETGSKKVVSLENTDKTRTMGKKRGRK